MLNFVGYCKSPIDLQVKLMWNWLGEKSSSEELSDSDNDICIKDIDKNFHVNLNTILLRSILFILISQCSWKQIQSLKHN